MLGSFLALPYLAFIPYFARDVLHSNERGLGTLMACSGGGSLLGAGTVAYLNMVKGRSIFLFAAGLAFFSMIILFCFSRSFLLSAILLMGAGYASVLMGVTANAVVQHIVAEHVRGRVMSIYFTAVTGLPPIGGLLAASLSRVFPVSCIIAAMAGLAFAGSVLLFAGSRQLRRLD
jgi:MFS family permease